MKPPAAAPEGTAPATAAAVRGSCDVSGGPDAVSEVTPPAPSALPAADFRFLYHFKKRRAATRRIESPAKPPTTPPTTSGVGGLLELLDPWDVAPSVGTAAADTVASSPAPFP